MLSAVGILVILVSWGAILQDWRRGIVLLLTYMPFAGVVTLSLYPSPLPTLFKDFFFVIPVYMAFWLTRRRPDSGEQVPDSIVLAMLALAAMVFAQSFNPELANWVVAAIGAKVWLFYLPLLFMAFAMLDSHERLIRLFRLMAVIAWIPCGIGIAQWIACMTFGYEETMRAIYGAAADGATQNFAMFNVGGDFFRIPSTFTFVTQYFGFTLAMIVPAYALANMDTSAKWRRFSGATMWLVIVAAFMSGARAAYLFVPALLTLIYWLEGRWPGLVKIAIVLPLVLLAALTIAGIDPLKMFEMMQELFTTYSEEVAQKSLLDAITAAPFGTGTGMNTGPARYAFGDASNFVPVENYYAKAVIELGIAGLVAVVAIFLVLIFHGYETHRRIRDAGLRNCSAAFLAFVATMGLNSFKGWQIDLDPINVYFWIFSGFLLKLPHLEKLARVSGNARQGMAEDEQEPSARAPRPI